MNEKVFDKIYSDQYDLLYGGKNYEAECDLLEEVFKCYADNKVQSILDLGCGTGNHAIPLVQRGYEVTGVDLSEDMLIHARKKTDHLNLVTDVHQPIPVFLQGDLRSLNLNQTFDVVLMMFAVLGYQYSNADVLEALKTARQHLRKGGLLIFDIWYGPAVLAIRPSDRVKVLKAPEGQLIRAASGDLDIQNHLCEVRYHLWCLSGERLQSETQETHQMRFFFPQELKLFLSLVNFSLQSLTAFPTLDQPADETSWNVLGVARQNFK